MKKLFLILFLLPLSLFAQIGINNNGLIVSKDGSITYRVIHIVASADNITYTPGNNGGYFRLKPGFVSHDSNGITLTGDSFKIWVAGDYEIHFAIGYNGTGGVGANDIIRIKTYINNTASADSIGRFRFVAGTGLLDHSYFWYLKHLTAPSYITFRRANETSLTRTNVINDVKVLIRRIPEK